MYVEESGDGPTVVLLHAMGFAHDMWDPQFARLADRFHVVAPDLPGYGRTPGPFSFDTAVRELTGLAAAGPVHLCGVSLGARVALRFAAERPAAVASLFLSGCGVRAPRGLAVRRAALRAVPERFFTRESTGAGKAVTLQSCLALAGLDLSGCPPKVGAPTLVTCGSKDTAYLADARELAAGIDGAELRVIAGVGHVWNRERPELFTRTLLEWVLAAERRR
ncbi:3-oxoadipate enol-lactonase [Actinoallomurus bryophytorum]|uniref:Pimeloyl-ACP methyl ester carboxylesterase n=1 Tax=Actinoallomurus bryophytorum TaxID=1490222 RepID=A0A543CQ49_9ACTN|nr:alpha/beta fold hydrolase [Actinoallomurus bryophytorum]TQL99100.1 pimeloyl-ACP methyl ester carboxylesterase [Actinoallomurus bryophytorum]